MRFLDIIEKKRDNQKLTQAEINFWISDYVAEKIPDYQVSALCMAIYFNGMDEEEIAWLTEAMLYSGDVIDLSDIQGIKADKHSTGGVGDKTSLTLAPMVAACGLKVAKMSGRGLGHTGGTLDKVESIEGYNIALSEAQFKKQVSQIGLALVGQTTQVVPADKKLYSLRDVSGTVNSIPLIASSIMSKKLASGADTILLDVKFGEGAFMKTPAQAKQLAQTMISIGKHFKRDTRAMISNMNQPLGYAIGNALEVKEAVNTLHNQGPADFTQLCIEAGSIMLVQGLIAKDREEGRKMCQAVLENGQAFNKLVEMVQAQSGNINQIKDLSLLPQAKQVIEIPASQNGYIQELDALQLGTLAMKIGAGRMVKEDKVNHAVGIVLNKKEGDYVNEKDIVAYVHTDTPLNSEWLKQLDECFMYTDKQVVKPSLIYEILEN